MEFGLIAATAADWPIVGQIAWVFGKLMDAIYNFLNLFGIQNIGICIILFTIIIYTLMIPLTIKQQKFSKMQAPEYFLFQSPSVRPHRRWSE